MKLGIFKDGGPLSHVRGFFFPEIKNLFSIAVLRFADGSREAYHSHAFNSVSWVLKGKLVEHFVGEPFWNSKIHLPSLKPIFTSRTCCHKVVSEGATWVFTLRGPWCGQWIEKVGETWFVLTHGRKTVEVMYGSK